VCLKTNSRCANSKTSLQLQIISTFPSQNFNTLYKHKKIAPLHQFCCWPNTHKPHDSPQRAPV
jgi:hypothetical protein